MQYNKIDPEKDLSHSIVSYIFYKSNSHTSIIDTFFPNGKPAIVFHFQEPFCFRDENDQWQPMSNVSFIGCQTIPVNLKNEGKIDTIAILLHPYSLYNIFNIRIVGLYNNHSANQYFSEDFIIKLAKCATMNLRVELLDNFFSEKLIHYNPDSDIFKSICDCIIHNKGCIERKEVSSNFSLSENYIHKLFIKKIGISFKPYAQIVRISNILEEIYTNNSSDWFEILLKYGYYDQSHFIKDFKKITGKTPKQYYKSDKTLSSILTGIA